MNPSDHTSLSSRVLKKSFCGEKTCEFPRKLEGHFSKTPIFQQPASHDWSTAATQAGQGSRTGLTLMELLIVMGVIAVLAGLLLPGLLAAKEKARRTACLNNLRQMIASALIYADDDPGCNLSAAVWEGDRNMNWLYPLYTDSLRTFTCPSTRNVIRTNTGSHSRTGARGLLDLFRMADSAQADYGTSYLLSGFMGWRTPYHTDIEINGRLYRVPFVKKTTLSVQSYVHYHNAFGLRGVMPGPANIHLFLDNTWSGYQDYPDPGDNHGEAGANAAYCDGHVEWLPRARFLYAHELSQDDNRSEILYPP